MEGSAMERVPVLSFDEYKRCHIEFSSLTAKHITTAWGEGKLTNAEVSRTLKRAIDCGYAINMHSRVAHAAAASDILADVVEKNPGCSFYAIDLVCRDFIFDMPEGSAFDVRTLKKWVRARLPNVDFVGGIDLAYYYAGNLVPGKKPPFLSWHAHVIAWGVSEEDLHRLKEAAEEQFSAGWTKAQVFYYRGWAADKIVGRAMYALKSTMSEYSAALSKERIDDVTGEVKGGNVEQEKRPLRPGHRLDIIRAIGDRTIADLMMAAGRGKKVRSKILANAGFQQIIDAGAQRQRRIDVLGLPRTCLERLEIL